VGATFTATKVRRQVMPLIPYELEDQDEQPRDEFNRTRPPQFYTRTNGNQAVCFHCRCRIGREGEVRGQGVFRMHFDVSRYKRLGEQGEIARPGNYRNIPCIVPGQQLLEEELCPGTGTMPIPLASRFPDGGKMPRYF
jgi:hypothetical protein